MAGWDYYVLEKQNEADPKDFLDRLAKLGSQSWELVAVDADKMYFKRYANYEAQLRTGVAAENEADGPMFNWVADSAAGQKRVTAQSSMDSGPNGVEHDHRVVAIVGPDMQVLRGASSEVDGHVHPVTLLGVLDEADGHTHTFAIEGGGAGTFQYESSPLQGSE